MDDLRWSWCWWFLHKLWWIMMIIYIYDYYIWWLWFPVWLYLIVLSYDDKKHMSVFLHVFASFMKNYNPMLQRYSPSKPSGHRNHSSSLGQVGPCWHWMWPLSSRPCAWTSQRKEWVPWSISAGNWLTGSSICSSVVKTVKCSKPVIQCRYLFEIST